MSEFPPSADEIRAAHARIRAQVHHTPVLTSTALNQITGASLFFKCENLQRVGAFKIRGATNAVLSLLPEELEKGVATHSSGNHAAALALAARTAGVPAYIVMPRTAPQVKRKAVAGYGAEIFFCEPTLQAREDTLKTVIKDTGATPIHPFNDYRIITGQATAALELLESVPGLDWVLAPVGGGGLLSGTALAVRYFGGGARTLGCEPELAGDAALSLQTGEMQPAMPPLSIADGLLTSLGDKTFAIIRDNVSGIVTVTEDEIRAAMRLIWERMKILVEPSSAVPLAAILNGKADVHGKRVGIILSGGNVDLDSFRWN